MHWSDRYLGLPFLKGGRDRHGLDCYGLVRLVWAEQKAHILPRHDEWDRRAEVLARETKHMQRIAIGQEKAFDVVIMHEDVRLQGAWVKAPLHMGVVVSNGLVLHVEDGGFSRIDALRDCDVAEILR